MRKQKGKDTARKEQCQCKGVGYIIRGDSDNVEEIEVHVCRVCKRYRNAWDALRAHMLRRSMLLVCPRCHGNGFIKDVLRDGDIDSLRIACCTVCNKFKGDFNAMLKAYLGQHEVSRTVRKTEERVPLVPTCNENVQVALNNAVLNHKSLGTSPLVSDSYTFQIEVSVPPSANLPCDGDTIVDVATARARAMLIIKEALEIASANATDDTAWEFSYRDKGHKLGITIHPKGGE